MSRDPQQASQLFSQIDITAGSQGDNASQTREHESEQIDLLHQILSALDRNNDLLEDIAASALANQRQRGDELQKWRQANPDWLRVVGMRLNRLPAYRPSFSRISRKKWKKMLRPWKKANLYLTNLLIALGQDLRTLTVFCRCSPS